jgi:conjugative relaxase-like TrwC/TraI family protein
MFTMSKIRDNTTSGNNFMFDHLSCNDYYSEDEKIVGYWYGSLANQIGLSGREVDVSEFVSIQKNENPWTGEKLTPAVRDGSVRFFDFQCSAQKSVSIMAVVMNDRRLVDAHNECVRNALSELEKFAACRIRKGDYRNSNALEFTGKILAALYGHDASRALDPQIHTHCVVANVTWSESEQRYKALSEHEMVKAIRYAGKHYQTAMARKVQELGYPVDVKRTEKGIEGYEISGISEELMERYSRRRAEIEVEIEKFVQEAGREPTAAEIHVIAKATREAKLSEITTPEVRAAQRQMLTEEDRRQLADIKTLALEIGSRLDRQRPGQIKQLFSRAIDHLYERRSVVAGHELLAEALNLGMGKAEANQFKETLLSDPALVPLTQEKDPLQIFYTTKQNLAWESNAIQMANDGTGQYSPLGNIEGVNVDGLAEDQQEAVTGILANQDFACVLRGFAGAGKTTALQQINAGLAGSEWKPLYLAPTRGAVNVLIEDGFADATTIAAFLQQPTEDKNLLVIDESSLVSARLAHEVMSLAKNSGFRILFVGDKRQHLSVEAGDFLRVIEQYSNINVFELSQIKRQVPAEYRKAIRAMASGNAADGLERLERLGMVEDRGNHYLAAAALKYVLTIEQESTALLVAPTHREIDTLNDLVRKELADRKRLDLSKQVSRTSFNDFGWTREQLGNITSYKPGLAVRFNTPVFGADFQKHDIFVIENIDNKGNLIFTNGKKVSPVKVKNQISVGQLKEINLSSGDKILITANDKKLNLTNGDVGVVESINSSGEITLFDGRKVSADFVSLSYGYATTSHKSQGSTCDHAILAAAQLDDRACYVGSSRGRQNVKVYCPDFDYLLSGVKRSSEQLAAHDLILSRNEYLNVQKKPTIGSAV